MTAFTVASRTVMLAGLWIFLPAVALIVAGLSQASFVMFLVGTVVGGVAVGSLFLGSLATANRLAPAAERSQVVSTYFLFAYIGLTIPVIALGVGRSTSGTSGPRCSARTSWRRCASAPEWPSCGPE